MLRPECCLVLGGPAAAPLGRAATGLSSSSAAPAPAAHGAAQAATSASAAQAATSASAAGTAGSAAAASAADVLPPSDTAHTSSIRAPGGTAGGAQPRSPAAGPDIDFDLEEDDEDAEALAALAEAEAAEATATAQRHGGASSSSSSSSAVSLGGDAGDDSRSGDLARATGGAEDGLDDVDVDWAALDDFDDEEEHDDPATPVIALDDDPQLPGGDGGRPAQGTDDADDDGEGGRLSGATDDPRRSSAAPALSASQPWTERAVTFSGLRVDVSGGGVAKLSAAIASGADTRQAVLSPAALAALTGLPAAAASNALRSIASMPKPAELPLVARLAASLAAFRGDAELVEVRGADPPLLLRELFAHGTQAVDSQPVQVLS